jgi:hypothetical protein
VAENKAIICAIRVRYVCDKCLEGDMRPTGETLLSDPPKFPHVCEACGHKGLFCVIYPHIRYEEVGTA